jgi:redox-sensitive bicupin YhaK (pirin superfamily)
MGNGSVIRPGDVQRMSAGTGVMHSEFNPSSSKPVHFLQIWIQPQAARLPPSYEQKHFSAADRRGRLRLIVSPDASDGSLTIHQDVRLHAGLFDGAERAAFALAPGRRLWLQVADGSITAGDTPLVAGDGVYTAGPTSLSLHGGIDANVLLFDLP